MTFDVAATAYDAFMGRYSMLLVEQMADLAGVRPGQRVIDVGCGTGALTMELVRRVGADRVAGVDPSDSLLAAARARLPGVDLRLAGAEQLPYDANTFDAALAQLVVHFMADPVAGVAEMARVTRTGGVVVACVWDFAGGRSPLSPFWTAVQSMDTANEGESRYAGAREGHLVEIFEAAGLRDVEQSVLEADLTHPGFEDWWDPFTRGVGPAGSHAKALDEDQRAELRARTLSLLPAGPFTIEARAWAARGRA
jgi:SAM-dependent methyltransferase